MEIEKHYYTEPFASQFETLLRKWEKVNEAKANGTYKPSAISHQHSGEDPPTAKQLSYLSYLGSNTIPQSRWEASRLIGQLKK